MPYTLQATQELVRKAVEAHPNRVNPQSAGGCVYTSMNGKSHCIAGQVFADVGLPMPDRYAGGIKFLGKPLGGSYTELVAAFTPEAWEYLQLCQDVFDGTGVNHPRKWSSALKIVENRWEEPDQDAA